jgi:hypothetical protein
VTDQQGVSLVLGGATLFAVLIMLFVARRSGALSARLLGLTTSFGWESPRRIFWGGVRGRWRGIDVELRHLNRYKGVPERLLLTMKTASPARVIVKRRMTGFLSKPLTWFGPPFVDPMNLYDRERYWVRSNELAYVERLFARAAVAPALEPTSSPDSTWSIYSRSSFESCGPSMTGR